MTVIPPCSHLIVSIIWSHSEAVPPAPCHVTTGQAPQTCPGTRRHVASVSVRSDMMWRITHPHSLLLLSCPSDLETLSCRRLVEPCRGPSLLDLLCSVSVLFAFQEACIDIWYDNDIFSNNYVFVPGLVRLTGKLRSRYLNVCMNIG